MPRTRNPNGMGSIVKLKNGYYRWRQMVDGETRELKSKSYQDLQEKIKKVADLPVIKSKLKVDEWFTKWLNEVKSLKKPATYEQYFFIYKKHIKPVIGNKKLISVKRSDIQQVISKMHVNGMATKTMKHAKTVMSVAFNAAIDDRIIHQSPVVKIDIPGKQAKERKVLTTSELSKMFKAMKSSRWIWSVKFMLYTGVRRGELLALKWTDIEWENKRIKIDESNSSTGLGDTKSRKIHYVPLSDNVISCLNQQLQMLKSEGNPITFDKNNKQMKDLRDSNLLIFPTIKGTMIKPNTYYHTIVRYAEKAGVKATPHCFRHTFVYLTRKTLSLKELQEILGHDESTTTLDIYGEMINDTIDKSAIQIDNVFSEVDLELEKLSSEIEKGKGKVIDFNKYRKAK